MTTFAPFFSGHNLRSDGRYQLLPDVHRGRHLADLRRLPPHPDRGPVLLHVPRLCPAVLVHGRGEAGVAKGGALSRVSLLRHIWTEIAGFQRHAM